MLLAALLVARKLLRDHARGALVREMSLQGGVPCGELLQLEVAFLFMSAFELYVSVAELAEFNAHVAKREAARRTQALAPQHSLINADQKPRDLVVPNSNCPVEDLTLCIYLLYK
eukprot:TRINITY_DN750_c0_g1_i14.p1 TRINITY_DN750_c0_g1~~TRINITY_DN750_c0_g1_i14.p1  ORF type:complete len:115 (-),score=50.43 TRINITY_DN750_c0_g1_i14:575-919(-)